MVPMMAQTLMRPVMLSVKGVSPFSISRKVFQTYRKMTARITQPMQEAMSPATIAHCSLATFSIAMRNSCFSSEVKKLSSWLSLMMMFQCCGATAMMTAANAQRPAPT